MYITAKKNSRSILQKPCKMCGEGLGADEYQGQSQAGKLLTTAAGFYNPLTQVLPIKSIPLIGKLDPISMAAALMTGGITLIPGISNIVGGLFKKATHFGDCMKWWSDSNIRGMASGLLPYPIDVVQNFPEASREYQLQHATSVMNDAGVIRALYVSSRTNGIVNVFVMVVRSNPDLMQLQCAVQAKSKGEDTGVNYDQSFVNQFWDQLKESARQQEYSETMQKISSILASYTVTAAAKVNVIQSTRQTGLVAGPQAFQLPTGVKSIDKGAVVLMPGVSSNLTLTYAPTGSAVIRKK